MNHRIPFAGVEGCPTLATSRRGFTLLEVLTVVSVIAILSAILIPAVQSARESSRRLQCTNNLKQIGIALSNYSSTESCFPPIYQPGDTPSAQNRGSLSLTNTYSPLVRVLAYLDQQVMFNSVNFQLPTPYANGMAANQTIMMTSISGFLCPSDEQPPVEGFGRVNYRFCTGDIVDLKLWTQDNPSLAGTFSDWRRSTFPADFKDGLSYTVGVSERLQGDWTKEGYKRGGDYLLGSYGYVWRNADGAIALCRSLPLAGPQESKGGEAWFLTGYHFTNYNHCAAPNNAELTCSFDPYIDTIVDRTNHIGSFPATSYHSGGVNALLMDGSVRFFKDSINLRTWRGLATPAGGEVLSSE